MTQSELTKYGHDRKVHFGKIEKNFASEIDAINFVNNMIEKSLNLSPEDADKPVNMVDVDDDDIDWGDEDDEDEI